MAAIGPGDTQRGWILRAIAVLVAAAVLVVGVVTFAGLRR